MTLTNYADHATRELRASTTPAAPGTNCGAGWDFGEGCYRPATIMVADLWLADSRTDLERVPRCEHHGARDLGQHLALLRDQAREAAAIRQALEAERDEAERDEAPCLDCYDEGGLCGSCEAEAEGERQYERAAGK